MLLTILDYLIGNKFHPYAPMIGSLPIYAAIAYYMKDRRKEILILLIVDIVVYFLKKSFLDKKQLTPSRTAAPNSPSAPVIQPKINPPVDYIPPSGSTRVPEQTNPGGNPRQIQPIEEENITLSDSDDDFDIPVYTSEERRDSTASL